MMNKYKPTLYLSELIVYHNTTLTLQHYLLLDNTIISTFIIHDNWYKFRDCPITTHIHWMAVLGLNMEVSQEYQDWWRSLR